MPTGSTSHRLRPFQPTRFGRYTLLAPLSTGVMGELFLARIDGAKGLERLCVIKRMLPQFANDREFVERFTAEARTLLTLSHGNIAQILDASVHEGTPFIALEYVDGKDLARVLSRMKERGLSVPLSFTLTVACRVLEALALAHRKRGDDGKELGLVHRDVSASNVVISYDGEVKVIDFGLAKSAFSTAKTNPGTGLLGLRSMAPEQARSQQVDRRADVYALGLVLFEMVTGRHPFEGLNDAELLTRVAQPKHVPANQLEPLCPPTLSNAIGRALAVAPADRFQSAEEFRQALQTILQDLEPNAGTELVSRVMHEAFAAEFGTERKWLAQMKTLEVGAGPAGDSGDETAESASVPGDELPVIAGVVSRTGEHAIPTQVETPVTPLAPVVDDEKNITPAEPLPSIMVDGVESEELPASAPLRKSARRSESPSQAARPKVARAGQKKPAPSAPPAPEKKKPKAPAKARPSDEAPVKVERSITAQETRLNEIPATAKKSPVGLVVGVVVAVLLVASAWFGWSVFSERFAVSTPVDAEAVAAIPAPQPVVVKEVRADSPDVVAPAVPAKVTPAAGDDDLVAVKTGAAPKRKPGVAPAVAKPVAVISDAARAFKALEADYRKLEGVNEAVVKKQFRIEFNVLADMNESNPNYLSRVNALHEKVSAELARPENR